ncbi:hypothetical protein [Streptomyces sp. NBC_01022]|uniref:hypothetical protein n=1 Tax=Streptomyces sp. NBC_01022 TaxID=2903723 RepID=UPI002DDC0DAD|nr:hypothetical protein [Streptomyces sp. NBC_01022]WRZ79947.1 hypothetical protein OG316_06565 [Streptomyces sp. NBC_01022]
MKGSEMGERTTNPWYRFIDEDIEHRTRETVGFTNLIADRPYALDTATLQGFIDRNALIRTYQRITRDVFMASVRGEADPAIADSILSCQPPERGIEYHRGLTERQLALPVYFRTDEAAPGAIAEIQCPASGWEIAEQMYSMYQEFPGDFGAPDQGFGSLIGGLATSLHSRLGPDPVAHHLTNNASRPHGVHYTVQRLREAGIRHFGWDPVHWKDCNFVRAHEFYDLRYNGLFDQWMEECEKGELSFDHPPIPLYDAKVAMAWPFWDKARAYYPDEIRGLFPHTEIITPDGFHMPDGSWISLEDYCTLGERKRVYYFKFGSHHPTLNWGSRAVYFSGSFTTVALRQLFERILADSAAGHHWVAQEARMHPEQAGAVTREGEELKIDAYTKFSAFYTPERLVGVLAMQERSRKVHGSPQTVVSIAY